MQAVACVMLFRGRLEGVRVHGGGTDHLDCLHLMAHLLWKLGYNAQCLSCLKEVMQRRSENSLGKSVRLLPSSSSGGGSSSSSSRKGSTSVGATSFEDSWQLLVEMGLEVNEGGDSGRTDVDQGDREREEGKKVEKNEVTDGGRGEGV